jgi:hypothetical protein
MHRDAGRRRVPAPPRRAWPLKGSTGAGAARTSALQHSALFSTRLVAAAAGAGSGLGAAGLGGPAALHHDVVQLLAVEDDCEGGWAGGMAGARCEHGPPPDPGARRARSPRALRSGAPRPACPLPPRVPGHRAAHWGRSGSGPRAWSGSPADAGEAGGGAAGPVRGPRGRLAAGARARPRCGAAGCCSSAPRMHAAPAAAHLEVHEHREAGPPELLQARHGVGRRMEVRRAPPLPAAMP